MRPHRQVPRLGLTALGVKAAMFYGLIVGAFWATPYANLFFLLLVFLTVSGAMGAVSSWSNLRGVRGVLVRFDQAAAGTPITGSVELAAGGGRRFLLEVQVRLQGAARGWSTVARVGTLHGTTQVKAEVPALPRGRYEIARARVASRYPFGLFGAAVELAAHQPLVVYPQPIELGSAQSMRELLAGLQGAQALAAMDATVTGLRPWQQGDALRRVHWRATARRGALVVREWEDTTQSCLEVSLDRRADPAVFEPALAVLAGLALWARDHKDVLVVRAQDLTATFGENQRPWSELFEYLAATQPLPASAPPPPACSPAVLRLPAPAAVGVPRA